MINRLLKALQRTDLLLVALCMMVSALFIYRFGSFAPQVAVVEQAPISAMAAEPEPQEAVVRRDNVSSREPVRFLMYNAQNYFVAEDAKRSRHERRIKTVAEREKVAEVIASEAPDVVGLIEMGGPAALDDLATRLAARGLNYYHRTVLTRWTEDRALAVLSRYPIIENHSIADCKLLGQTSRNMLRGILDVSVKVGAGKEERRFRIMGVHLKSRIADDAAAATSLRAREARTLAARVQQILRSHPEELLLVYGDWNDGPSEPALSVMTRGTSRATTLHRLKPEDARGESWTIYYKPGNEYNTFDQVYVSDALYKRMNRNKAQKGIISEKPSSARASDHRAVWCDMY